MPIALTSADMFDGENMRGQCTIIIDEQSIAEIRPAHAAIPNGVERIDLGGKLLAPGFVDVQVNGGGGVMFNSDQSVDALKSMVAAHRRFGTTSLLPTVITDTAEVMQAAAEAVKQALGQKVPGIIGVHFEGPCLNPQRKGVHDPARMSGLTTALMEVYTRKDIGSVVVTLAPEQVQPGQISKLVAQGVRVSAGHTQADVNAMAQAADEGLSGVTHLFNAMPPMAGREPSVVGATMADARIWAGIIIDGIHVAHASARAAILAKGPVRVMLVTDAMGTVGSDQKSFELYGTEIFETEGRCATADGTLAGSALNMMQAVRNAHQHLGFPLADALRMASLTPAQFLGLDDKIGRIAAGSFADIVVIDPVSLTVQGTFLRGETSKQ